MEHNGTLCPAKTVLEKSSGKAEGNDHEDRLSCKCVISLMFICTGNSWCCNSDL